MVLTRSMATTNNQNEPHIIAYERQVQTLVATMEHLTKQNHDPEDQLRQNNVGPNNNGDEQEGTSAERRDQEGPEGSNALSRQEQQDTSSPSVVEIAPSYMVIEMQMMKKRLDFMMNALRGRESSDLDKLVHQTDFHFIAPVTSFPLCRSSVCYR